MKFHNLPDWLYFPFKLLLLASFFVPILLWTGQMLGYSKAQEASLAKAALQNAGSDVGVVMKYLDRERDISECCQYRYCWHA
jgi:hypothetical protein